MDNSPYAKILQEIEELMDFAYKHANDPIPVEKQAMIDKQLREVEAQAKEFFKESEKVLEGSRKYDYLFQMMSEDLEAAGIELESEALLKKNEALKAEAELAIKDISQAAAIAEQRREEGSRRKEKNRGGKGRKTKYKGMGGYKDWKPL